MLKSKNKVHICTNFWCKYCGSTNVWVRYSYTAYGEAQIMSVDEHGRVTEHYDGEDDGSDYWKIHDTLCHDCDKDDVVTTELDSVKDLPNFVYEKDI